MSTNVTVIRGTRKAKDVQVQDEDEDAEEEEEEEEHLQGGQRERREEKKF